MRAIFLSALALTATASAKKLLETTVTAGVGDISVNLDASGTATSATGTAELKIAAANVMEVSAVGSFSKDTAGSGAELKLAAKLKFDSAVSADLNSFCNKIKEEMGDSNDICGLAGYDSSTSSMEFSEFTKTISRRQLRDLKEGRQLASAAPSVSAQEMASGMGGQAKMAAAFLQAFGTDLKFSLTGLTYDGADDKMPVSFNLVAELTVLDWDTHNMLDAYNTAADASLDKDLAYCCADPSSMACDYSQKDTAKCALRTAIYTIDTTAGNTFYVTVGGTDRSLWKDNFDVLKTMNDARRMRGRSLAMTLPSGVSIDSDGTMTAELKAAPAPAPAPATDGSSSGSSAGEDEGGSTTLIIILVILAIVGAGAGFAFKQKQAAKK